MFKKHEYLSGSDDESDEDNSSDSVSVDLEAKVPLEEKIYFFA